MKVVFIAGPYRGKTDAEQLRNIRLAEMTAKAVWQNGGCAICPHLNSAHFSGVVPEEEFLRGYLELVRRSDCIVTLPGWEKSEGARAEVKLAREMDLPIFRYASAITALTEDDDEDISL